MARHLFWGPQLSGPSLRALPLGPRGRFIGLGGPFMGQASSLSSLSIFAIQNRIMATPPLERLSQLLAAGAGRNGFSTNSLQRNPDQLLAGVPNLPQLTDAEISTIEKIAADPSSEDLDDVALIETFFAGKAGWAPDPSKPWQQSLTSDLCDVMNGKGRGTAFGRGQPSTAEQIYTWLTASTPGRGLSPGTPPNASDDEMEAIRLNPFYCGRAATLPDSVLALTEGYDGYFGINGDSTWGAVKLQVQNAVVVLNAVAAYPFPPPIDEYPIAFWAQMQSDVLEIISTPYPVDPEAVRLWITMAVLANYTDMTNKIEATLKKKAKNAKRKAIMTVIGLALASIVAAFLLPAVIAVIASAIKTAVTTYVDAQKRRKAAQDMANASKMFADDAPAFSKEVDHASQVMDQQAAEQEAALAPSPDVQAAIAEVKSNTGPAWGTILPVGGGIAAAGFAVFAIFR